MDINFPTSPSDGDTHVVGSKSLWRWRFSGQTDPQPWTDN